MLSGGGVCVCVCLVGDGGGCAACRRFSFKLHYLCFKICLHSYIFGMETLFFFNLRNRLGSQTDSTVYKIWKSPIVAPNLNNGR